MKTALLLLNLGTPNTTDPNDVGVYLKEFLMDAEVIDIPKPLRWLLVNVLIVPRRKFKSAEAYKQVWTKEGSPLRVNSETLLGRVREFNPDGITDLAMRYGSPSIESVLRELRGHGVTSIELVPLYPQYALSSTFTATKKVKDALRDLNWVVPVKVLKPFYDHPDFINGMAEKYQSMAREFHPDFTLMSYHGLPKRHLTKINSGCFTSGCCEQPSARSSTCYRYQSYATSRALAKKLALPADKWMVSFQSRLGPGWIEPFTDVVFVDLAKKGVKRLAVFSPSFVADCLETLEEIQIRGQDLFKGAGGEALRLVPALNGDPMWAKAIANFRTDNRLWQEL